MVDAYHKSHEARGVKCLGCPLLELDMFSKCVANRVSCLISREKNPIHTTYDPILESLGAILVTTSPAEAYAAMERGVVDGLGWPDIGLLDFKFYEQQSSLCCPISINCVP